jgi:RimJ/RimL family protein N-acetyltransferase
VVTPQAYAGPTLAMARLFTGGMHPDGSTAAPTDPVVTPRLVLTPIGPDDIEDMVVLYGDPLVGLWTGPWTRATIDAWAADMTQRWAHDGVAKWMARDRSDGSLVGRGGCTRMDLDGEAVLELGWAIRDARTGHGYATELGQAAMDWAGVHHPDLPIVAFTEVHNRASRAVTERLEMRQVGIIRREGLIEGTSGLHADAPFALYRR